MKEIRVNDEAYRRAGDIASARNITISDLVEELVESVTGDLHPVTSDLDALFAALDFGACATANIWLSARPATSTLPNKD